MTRFLFLLSIATVFAVVFACNPTGTSGGAPANSTKARRRRSVEDEKIQVTVVTNKVFDESTKDLHYEMVKSVVTDFMKREGISVNFGKVEKKLINHEGKFAVEYKVYNDDCEQVKQFAKGAKATSNVFAFVLIKCGQQPVFLL